MTDFLLREDICRVGRSLYERGLVQGTAGNISVRLPDSAGFLITPSDACLGFLDAQLLARVDAAGQQLSGDRASKSLAQHHRIYARDADAHCVLHTHSTHLVALTLRGAWRPEAVLPPITPYQVMKIGRVPLVPYHRPGDPAVPDLIEALLLQAQAAGVPIRAVLCERLGPIVWHDSPAAAMAALEEFEETARLWLMHQPPALTAAQLDELQQHFGAQWTHG